MRKTLEQRFWEKVDKSGECWLWKGAKGGGYKGRYGIIWVNREEGYDLAHRVAYRLQIGPIPEGKSVCHDCPGGDEPLCMRGAHFFAGTSQENFADMVKKGRNAKGEAHGRSKLTEAQVRWAISQYEIPGVSQQRIADELGVGRAIIGLIVTKKVWKHLHHNV